MATTKICGRDLTLFFGAIDLSSASREISWSGEASEIDISTRDNVVEGSAAYCAGLTEWEWEANGLDTTGGHAAIKTIQIGDVDDLIIDTGQQTTTVEAVVLRQEYTSAYDGANEWTVGGRLNEKPVWAASAALATGATAGTPGTWTPGGSRVPANLAELNGATPAITASPATAWTTGQHVVLADNSHAHWDGTAPWVSGNAP